MVRSLAAEQTAQWAALMLRGDQVQGALRAGPQTARVPAQAGQLPLRAALVRKELRSQAAEPGRARPPSAWLPDSACRSGWPAAPQARHHFHQPGPEFEGAGLQRAQGWEATGNPVPSAHGQGPRMQQWRPVPTGEG